MKCSAEPPYWLWLPVVIVAVALCRSVPGWAQASGGQTGTQYRADAAARTIVLAVQQGIDALPPTSGQSFTWRFDPQLDVPVRSRYLGPTVLRTPDTIGQGRLALRVAASYFGLDDTLGPIDHFRMNDNGQTEYDKFGTSVSARVGVISMAATYGLTSQWDVTMNLPLVVVDAQAEEIYSTLPGRLAGADTIADLNRLLQPGCKQPGCLSLRRETFTALRFSFPEGTHTGVGRISVGAKGAVYSRGPLSVALAPEFFFPSPNEGQLAGSGTAAILPRAVAGFEVADRLRLYLDFGYDYDFDNDELRAFVWNAGASMPGERFTFDLGVGGSKFNSGLIWTPAVARDAVIPGVSPGSTVTPVEGNRLGDNFVNFLAGLKVRLVGKSVLEGAVSVPVNNEGVRPAAFGTLAVEQYF